MDRTLRWHWARLIGGSIVVLAAAFVAPRLVPLPELQENRRLAEAPAPPAGLGDLTRYRRDVDAWVADRFPARAHLIGGLNRLRLALGSSGSSRVIVGRDGWLFSDDGGHLGAARGQPAMDDAAARAWLAGLAGRSEALAAQGRAYVVLAPPTKAAIYPTKAPAWFAIDPNRPAVTLAQLAGLSGAGVLVYPNEALARPTLWGLRTYSPHDTHWTGLGAYHGYVALMRRLNAMGVAEPPRPLEAFEEERQGEANKPRDLALMLGVGSYVDVQYPELYDPAADAGFAVTQLDPGRRDWGGLRVIETGQAGKPVLLMTVDSFSNALLPFLLGHFSRIVTVHNDQGSWRPDLIARFEPDIVVTEVVEDGLRSVMTPSPAASPGMLARIDAALRRRAQIRLMSDPAMPVGRAQVIEGDEGPNHLVGRPGRDAIQGRPGDDTIEGRGEADILRGGRGRDIVDGGDGADWVDGGRGDDTLRGGRGADVFHSFPEAGTDVVQDFSLAEGDSVELDPGTRYTIRQTGADTVLEMPGARLILRNVEAATLPAGAVRIRRPPLAS